MGKRGSKKREFDLGPQYQSKDARDYKDGDGVWTTVLTALGTIDLNCFIKYSRFSKEEIADLKRVRRSRKNAVYTKRSRARRAALMQPDRHNTAWLSVGMGM